MNASKLQNFIPPWHGDLGSHRRQSSALCEPRHSPAPEPGIGAAHRRISRLDHSHSSGTPLVQASLCKVGPLSTAADGSTPPWSMTVWRNFRGLGMFIFVVLPFPKVVCTWAVSQNGDFPVCNFFYNRVDLFIRRNFFIRRKKTELWNLYKH